MSIHEWSPLRQEPEAPFNNATSRGLRANPRPEPGDCESRDSLSTVPDGALPETPVFRPGPSACRLSPDGFTYLALLVAIVIIGISLGAVTRYWSNISLREKEDELLFRGDQYRKAIERYTLAIPGRIEFPQSIDDLLADNRTAVMKRHLRRKYRDPISGEDFVEIRDQATRRIIGVNSPSEKEPLRQAGFPEEYKNFEGKKKYSDWQFVYAPVQPQPQSALSPTRPPQSFSSQSGPAPPATP